MSHTDLSILPVDHPGAHDPVYRARRNHIAQAAANFRAQSMGVVPHMAYTDQEHATWKTAVERLTPLHAQFASAAYLDARAQLAIPHDHIPQLRELNDRLAASQGFRLEPVEGLVDGRSFLSRLADRVMLCTQYIRHHSRPDYTPEPDIIHEVIGHVPTFTDPDMVRFSEHLGCVAQRATDAELVALERLYWFTLEFGLIQEGAYVKAFGAGLLSSFGELAHAIEHTEKHRPFSIQDIIQTPFDFSSMQTTYFVIPSFSELREQMEAYFGSSCR